MLSSYSINPGTSTNSESSYNLWLAGSMQLQHTPATQVTRALTPGHKSKCPSMQPAQQCKP